MLTRKMHDDLTPESRRYMVAFMERNRTGGTVPMEVFLANAVEHGLLVAHGEPGTAWDDMQVQRAPGFTDAEFKAGFDQLAPYMEDANS